MQIFRKKYLSGTFGERMVRGIETALKCFFLLLLPVPFSAGVTAFWYFVFYTHGIYFSEKIENITTAAWIPTFGILYGLIAAIVLSTVWSEYKSMRTAIKRYDINTFVDLRDEEMSPLVHTLLFVLSGSVLLAFMGLKYPDIQSGIILIASTTYLFALIFFVVIEIDDPTSGIWFIKSVHKEWLQIDVKKWRQSRWEKARNDIMGKD